MKIVLTAMIAILTMVTGAIEQGGPSVTPFDPLAHVATSVPTPKPGPSATPQPGKTPKPQTVEVKGTIEAIQGNTITVDGQKITLGPGVEIDGELKVGATVEIKGVQQPNGVIVAKEVEVKEDQADEDVEEDEDVDEVKEDEHEDKHESEIKDKQEDKHEDELKDKQKDRREDKHEDKREDNHEDEHDDD